MIGGGGERGGGEVQWHVVVMRAHVRSQIARQRELLQTDRTFERLLSAVDQQMILQIGLFRESTCADRTTEGPSAIVNVRMTTEITGRGKALRALRTFVRLVLQTSTTVSHSNRVPSTDLTLLCVSL